MADQTSGLTVKSTGLSSNGAAAISYFTFVPAIYFLLAEPYDKDQFVRFHSLQSVMFGFFAFAVQTLLFYLVPHGLVISGFISIIFFVLWAMVMIHAIKGDWFKLPIIGNIAMSQVKKPAGVA